MMPLARTLLDVLFASLWQDAIIGIALGMVLLLAGKRLNAVSRHVVLQAALIAMIVCPVATTIAHLGGHDATISGYGTAANDASNLSTNAQPSLDLRRIRVTLGDPMVLSVVVIWIVGAATFALRIALGILQLSRAVRRSEVAGERNGVRVYASSVLRVPVALGLIRPAIIVPADLVYRGGNELECVLLHELAHVQRHDAWSHTLERIVHALLFFNPAVMLLLQSLELEREAACDDWAVAHLRDTVSYTHSLATLAIRSSFNADMPAACGAMGFGHAIVSRIERLEDHRRNGSLLLSPLALGGFTSMLVSIALALQLLAPAIAFSAQPQLAKNTPLSSNCRRDVMVTFPAQPPGPLPSGRASVEVSVAATGVVTSAKIARSSGNAILDRAAVKMAKESAYEPAMRNCKPTAGTYHFMFTSTGA
jgi:TonB family protein